MMKLILHINLNWYTLTDTQVPKIRKAFVNGSSTDIKLSKPQLSQIIQSGGILGELLVALPYIALKAETQELMERAPDAKDSARYFVNKELIDLKKVLNQVKV